MSAKFRALAAALSRAAGARAAPEPEYAIGSSFDACHRWSTDRGALFVKLAALNAGPRLAAEAAGLATLAATATIRVPRVVGQGETEEVAWLALEWLDCRAPDAEAERALGAALARLHQVRGGRFGFDADNFIGATPQPNGWLEDGVEFLVRRRLGHQLELAARSGYGRTLAARGEHLLGRMSAFFSGYAPVPVLLHGDLWAGNRAMLADGTPVVFDPAVYFGDREAELAMTRLFGGFGAEFYAAYSAELPPAPGAAEREGLHRLYHVLNHLNLFGGGYLGQAAELLDRLNARAS